MFLHLSLAIGFVLSLGFAPFKVWAEMRPLENRWFDALLGMLTLTRFLNRYPVMSIYRCHCIDAVFLVVVHKPVLHVIFRLRSSIVFQPPFQLPCVPFRELSPAPFPSGGGGFLVSSFVPVVVAAVAGAPIFANLVGWYLQE